MNNFANRTKTKKLGQTSGVNFDKSRKMHVALLMLISMLACLGSISASS